MTDLFTPQGRAELTRLLDRAAAAVQAEYDAFVHSDSNLDPTAFGRRHNAAKACLGHLETLARLHSQLVARNGEADSEADPAGAAEPGLIAAARQRLAESESSDHPSHHIADARPEGP